MRSDLVARLWRARRRHDHVDAMLEHDGVTWRLSFLRNDRPLLTMDYADREIARVEAKRRLRELQRAGWTVHW